MLLSAMIPRKRTGGVLSHCLSFQVAYSSQITRIPLRKSCFGKNQHILGAPSPFFPAIRIFLENPPETQGKRTRFLALERWLKRMEKESNPRHVLLCHPIISTQPFEACDRHSTSHLLCVSEPLAQKDIQKYQGPGSLQKPGKTWLLLGNMFPSFFNLIVV